MRTKVARRNHDYEDRGLAIGRYIFIANTDKDKGEEKDENKETKVHCRGRPKDKSKDEGTDTKVA